MITETRITWRNGFRLNNRPVMAADIRPIFEERRTAAIWEHYEQLKAELRTENLDADAYQAACLRIADALGI